jgi:hypothetical protein
MTKRTKRTPFCHADSSISSRFHASGELTCGQNRRVSPRESIFAKRGQNPKSGSLAHLLGRRYFGLPLLASWLPNQMPARPAVWIICNSCLVLVSDFRFAVPLRLCAFA